MKRGGRKHIKKKLYYPLKKSGVGLWTTHPTRDKTIHKKKRALTEWQKVQCFKRRGRSGVQCANGPSFVFEKGKRTGENTSTTGKMQEQKTVRKKRVWQAFSIQR